MNEENIRTSSFLLPPSSFSKKENIHTSSFLLPPSSFSPAFTLIELLVVIAIIGILAAVFTGVFGKSRDTALAAKCLANMKNLATAVQSYGLGNGAYPWAGSVECMTVDTSEGKRQSRLSYYERKGWISWASKDVYPAYGKQNPSYISMYTSDKEEGLFAVTNGALWRYVGGNRSIYVCPAHAKLNQGVYWTYVMSAFFGWAAAENYSYSSKSSAISYGKLSAADRRLLFAEIPFMPNSPGDSKPSAEGSGTDTDCVLQYKDSAKTRGSAIKGKGARSGEEYLGANHKSGRDWFAHVVFADGHIEKIRTTKNDGQPLSDEDLKKLTKYLCEGDAVAFDGSKYEKIDN